VFVAIAFLTALFSFRAFFVIFGKKSRKKLKREFTVFFPIVILAVISTFGGVIIYFFNAIEPVLHSFDAFSFISLAAALLGVFVSYELFYAKKEEKTVLKMQRTAVKLEKYRYERFIIGVGNAVSDFGYYIGRFDSLLSSAASRAAESTFILSSKTREIENGDAFRYITAVVIGLIAVILVAVIFI
jgi:NADH:ubiquinone oxidoreductase subunit 5 (subunit L)/multisubunit Na+/H+ antiporter MnhA subunit